MPEDIRWPPTPGLKAALKRMEEPVSQERKADMPAQLTELEFEIALAIRQGSMPTTFNWTETFEGPDGEPWIAVMTIGKVSNERPEK